MSKDFAQVSKLNPRDVLIVDSLNLAFRWKHQGQFEFTKDYIQTIESLKNSFKTSKVVIAADWGASSYRKTLYPEYKGNRELLKEKQTEEEKQKFYEFLEGYNNVINTYIAEAKYPVFKLKNVEADDIAGFIVKNRAKLGIDKITLASSDKDWDLLVSENVQRFSYVTRKIVTLDAWPYDCAPEEYISIKCLQGDSGDNIPGVAGIGPKKAAELVKQYGTCLDIIANLPIQSKYKYIQNLNAFGADKLLLNYQLMDLLEFSDKALGDENCKIVLDKLKELFKSED